MNTDPIRINFIKDFYKFHIYKFYVHFFQSQEAPLVAQLVKNLTAMRETRVGSLGWEDPLQQEMAAHSSMLAWRTLWTEEPGGLQSMGSQRVGQD